jgi:co-chaperonin GroES (HSP10)
MFFYRPWIKVGDHIYYARYAGKRVLTPDTKEELLYLNDEDVAGLV